MKKALMIVSILFIAVISTGCINNMAVQELNNKASEYMAKGDYEAAMNRLEASLDLDSSMYQTYYNLGIAAINAKKYEKAIDAFEKGIKINPEYKDFYYSLGVAQISLSEELLGNSEEVQDEENKIDNVEQPESSASAKQVSEEDKAKAVLLKQSAANNLKKYLENNPDAEYKDSVNEMINDANDFIAGIEAEKTAEQPKE